MYPPRNKKSPSARRNDAESEDERPAALENEAPQALRVNSEKLNGKSSLESERPLNSLASSDDSIFEDEPVTYTVAFVQSITRRRKRLQSGTSWISSKKRKQPSSRATGCSIKYVSITAVMERANSA